MEISPDWALGFVFLVRIYIMCYNLCCLLSLCISEKCLWLKAAIKPFLILLPLQLSKDSSLTLSPPWLASTALSPACSRIWLLRAGNRRLLTELWFKYPWSGSCLPLCHPKFFLTSLKIPPMWNKPLLSFVTLLNILGLMPVQPPFSTWSWAMQETFLGVGIS